MVLVRYFVAVVIFFSKTLRNYAVRVDMLRDLRLAGSTNKTLFIIRGYSEMYSVITNTETAHSDLARARIYGHIHANTNAESEREFAAHELKDSVLFYSLREHRTRMDKY